MVSDQKNTQNKTYKINQQKREMKKRKICLTANCEANCIQKFKLHFVEKKKTQSVSKTQIYN